jgi:GT2 family glycosyltransferase
MDSRISVIVCTKDRDKDLARFMDSLAVQTLCPLEFLVVDASAGDAARDLLEARARDFPCPVRHVRELPGLPRQRNTGRRESKGTHLAFFDDDIVLEPDVIRVFQETIAALDGLAIGGVIARITNAGRPAAGLNRFLKRLFLLTDTGAGRFKASGLPEHRVDGTPAFVSVAPGGCTLYPRAVLDAHPFDENLKGYAYMEDVDVSYRISRTHPFFYQPRARVLHLSSTHSGDTRALRRMLVRHHRYLFQKNSPKDALHTLAFAWSVLGLFLYNGLYIRDFRACLGMAEALLAPLRPE